MIRPLLPWAKSLYSRQIVCLKNVRFFNSEVEKITGTEYPSSREDVIKHQNEIYNQCRSRALSDSVPRIQKIEVQYTGHSISDDATLLMNKNLSTPYHCAMHISKELARDSVLAYVKKYNSEDSEDGTIVEVHDDGIDSSSTEVATVEEKFSWQPWDMNRPLEYDCELKLLHFNMSSSALQETKAVNRAYWNSCALVLGAVACEAFKSELGVQLVHLPQISEKSGAFCYDVDLTRTLLNPDGSSKWSADEAALINMTKLARKIISENLTFERLEVHKDDALHLFKHSEHFSKRVQDGAFTTVQKSQVPLYRFGKYIDVCDGPVIPSTSWMYHFVVTAVHQLRLKETPTHLWRFQGLSLPKRLQVHHAVWTILERRAQNFVVEDLPFVAMDSAASEIKSSLLGKSSIENKTKRYNIATGQWKPDQWESSNEKVDVSSTQSN